MDFYDLIDLILRDEHMSRRSLAEQAGIPPTSLQSAFTRKSKGLAFETIVKIADVLDLPANLIIGAAPFDNIPLLLKYKNIVLYSFHSNGLMSYPTSTLSLLEYFAAINSFVARVEKDESGEIQIEYLPGITSQVVQQEGVIEATLPLSDSAVIVAYRYDNADDGIKKSVEKLLDIKKDGDPSGEA
ncbi:MAG: helix-turn-helix domain-containing protein [Oscillospiraceae bacterium]|jgi:DNA-binding Xre family transcriptional regulator